MNSKYNFVHLRVYTQYSVNNSINSIKDIISKCKINKQLVAFVTDLNSLSSFIKFYKTCLDENIKPILGCEVYIKNKINDNPYKILLLVKNKLGYLNLCKIISKANIFDDKCQINKKWFLTNLSKGLIFLSGSLNGDFTINLIKNNIKLAKKNIIFWNKCFKNRIYLEIQKYDLKKKYFNFILNLSKELKIPIVATHPIFFIKKDDFLINEIRKCIYNNKIFKNTNIRNNSLKDFFWYPKKKK